MLAKARHYLEPTDIKALYYSTFHTHMNYGSQVWLQKTTQVRKNIHKLQKKALRIMSFSEFNASSSPLFKQWEILKLDDFMTIKNCSLAHDFLNAKLPETFNSFLEKQSEVHSIYTRCTEELTLRLPIVNLETYGGQSPIWKSITDWNENTKTIEYIDPDTSEIVPLKNLSKQIIASELKDKYFASY